MHSHKSNYHYIYEWKLYSICWCRKHGVSTSNIKSPTHTSVDGFFLLSVFVFFFFVEILVIFPSRVFHYVEIIKVCAILFSIIYLGQILCSHLVCASITQKFISSLRKFIDLTFFSRSILCSFSAPFSYYWTRKRKHDEKIGSNFTFVSFITINFVNYVSFPIGSEQFSSLRTNKLPKYLTSRMLFLFHPQTTKNRENY